MLECILALLSDLIVTPRIVSSFGCSARVTSAGGAPGGPAVPDTAAVPGPDARRIQGLSGIPCPAQAGPSNHTLIKP